MSRPSLPLLIAVGVLLAAGISVLAIVDRDRPAGPATVQAVKPARKAPALTPAPTPEPLAETPEPGPEVDVNLGEASSGLGAIPAPATVGAEP